jgi:hypothetical protein
MKRTGSVRCTYVGYTCVRSLNLSVGLVYAGGPFYGYVVQVHVVVRCACVHLHVDMLISSHLPILSKWGVLFPSVLVFNITLKI